MGDVLPLRCPGGVTGYADHPYRRHWQSWGKRIVQRALHHYDDCNAVCNSIPPPPALKSAFAADLLPPSPLRSPAYPEPPYSPAEDVPMSMSSVSLADYRTPVLRDVLTLVNEAPPAPQVNSNLVTLFHGGPRISEATEYNDAVEHALQTATCRDLVQPNSFDEHWTNLKTFGAGSFGYVCMATLKSTSGLYNKSNKGKVYAVKREHRPEERGTEKHSIYHERRTHEACQWAADWRAQRHFPWMICADPRPGLPSWIAYEYCEGPTILSLESLFPDYIPAGLVADVFSDVSSALTWLHAPGNGEKPRIAHGDLHGSNVMLDLSAPRRPDRYPAIKILDFGIADHLHAYDADPHDQHLYLEHRDINDMGHMIHRLIHKDPRNCGREHGSDGTQWNQTTHCHLGFSSVDGQDVKIACPESRDPSTAFFGRDDSWMNRIILHGCFRPCGQHYVNHGPYVRMAGLDHEIQKYCNRVRQEQVALPGGSVTFEDVMVKLESSKQPRPALPLSHQSIPPPPPTPLMPPPPCYNPGLSRLPSSGHDSPTLVLPIVQNMGDLPDDEYHDDLWMAQAAIEDMDVNGDNSVGESGYHGAPPIFACNPLLKRKAADMDLDMDVDDDGNERAAKCQRFMFQRDVDPAQFDGHVVPSE